MSKLKMQGCTAVALLSPPLQSFKLLLLADRERREPVWQELRRLLLRRSWAAAVAWVRGCVALLGGGAASAAGRATG